MKIDIQINNERIFAQVAMLVENETFQWQIEEHRKHLSKKYGVVPPITNEEFSQFMRDMFRTKKQLELDEEVRQIRYFFLLPMTFNRLITKVLFCNEINEKDTPIAQEHSFDEYIDEKTVISTPYVMFAPDASDKDILNAITRNSPYSTPFYWKTGKKTHAIREHRDWYWKVKEAEEKIGDEREKIETTRRKAIDTIINEVNNKCPMHGEEKYIDTTQKCSCIDLSTVQKGVDNFSKLRTTSIR